MLAQSDNAFGKSEFDIQKFVLQNPRKIGVLLWGLGFVFTYWSLLLPIQKATTGTSEITLFAEGAIVGIPLVIVGLAFILLGPTVLRVFNPARPSMKALLLVAGFILAGIGHAAHLWVKHLLESWGYVFR